MVMNDAECKHQMVNTQMRYGQTTYQIRKERMKKFSIVLLLAAVTSFAQENVSAWSHFKSITLNTTATGANSATLQTKFPIVIKLTSADADVFDGSQPNGQDIRFYKASNGVRLYHEIETWDKVNRSATIWVLVDSIKGSDSSAYLKMFWGNSVAKDSSKSATVFDTANGFQGVWHFGETVGALAHDATINGYNGTPYGTPKPADIDGVCGRAKKFDGATTYYLMPGTASSKLNLPVKTDITLSAWALIEHVTGFDQIIVTKGEYQYRLKAMTGWKGFDFSGGWDGVESAPATINQWKHIVFVKSLTTKHLYVDGVLDEISSYLTVSTANRLETRDLIVGKPFELNSGYLLGKLDEIRVENKARSQDWIKLCFANQKLIGQSLVTLGTTKLNTPTGIVISTELPTGQTRRTAPLLFVGNNFSFRSGMDFSLSTNGRTLVDIKGRFRDAQTWQSLPAGIYLSPPARVQGK